MIIRLEYKKPCAWCKTNLIDVAMLDSDGMCRECYIKMMKPVMASLATMVPRVEFEAKLEKHRLPKEWSDEFYQ